MEPLSVAASTHAIAITIAVSTSKTSDCTKNIYQCHHVIAVSMAAIATPTPQSHYTIAVSITAIAATSAQSHRAIAVSIAAIAPTTFQSHHTIAVSIAAVATTASFASYATYV